MFKYFKNHYLYCVCCYARIDCLIFCGAWVNETVFSSKSLFLTFFFHLLLTWGNKIIFCPMESNWNLLITQFKNYYIHLYLRNLLDWNGEWSADARTYDPLRSLETYFGFSLDPLEKSNLFLFCMRIPLCQSDLFIETTTR